MANPLLPGVVPSESREDAPALLQQQEGTPDKLKRVIKEGTLASDGGKKPDATEVEPSGAPVLAGTPLSAWQEPQQFNIDLSGTEGDDESGTSNIPIKKAGSQPAPESEEDNTAERKTWSPFSKPRNGVQELRKDTILSGKRPPQQQTTPKKPMLRRNKVAPSPTTTPTKPLPDVTPQRPSNAVSLGRKLMQGKKQSKTRPGSAPLSKEEEESRATTIAAPTITTVTAMLKTDDTSAGGRPVPDEPVYSTVVKVKPSYRKRRSSSLEDIASLSQASSEQERTPARFLPADQASIHKKEATFKEPEIIAAMPKLECYEPTEADTSIVIANLSAPEASSQNTLAVSGDSHMISHDADYDSIEEPDGQSQHYTETQMAAYDPALYKGLKKHEDKGNVHLVSVRGTSEFPHSQTVNFPTGSSQDMQPLHYAAASGNKKALSEILSQLPIMQDTVELVLGTDNFCTREGVDMRDSEGRTPFMHAVHNERVQCVKLLAEAGANVNEDADDGSTCLHQAAYSGTVEMVALLLSLGADGLKRDKDGRTPLHWCTNNLNPETVDILLDKVPSLDVNIRDGAMMTPLMWAAFHVKPEHIEKLKQRGADPALADMDGMTAVHWSVQRHDIRALQVLITTETSQYCDSKGKTVMHQAAEQGCAKAVSLIKAVRPTSVDDVDENGRTPLHWATVCENPEVIRALLVNGADSSIRDSSDHTALDYAVERGLHYCGLLLSKADGVDEPDVGYHSFLAYGTTAVSVGARALQQQEGQFLDPEEVKKVLTKEQILQIETVCAGSWISKFTNHGKGALHPRFFQVNPSNLKISWSKTRDASSKDAKSADLLVGVRSSASPAVFGRKDFDPLNKHKFSFTIFTTSRVLDVVALSSEDFKTWLNGLQLLLHLGSMNVARLVSVLQSGGEGSSSSARK